MLTQIRGFRTVTPVCIHQWLFTFQGHKGWKIDDLNPIGVRLLGRSQLSNPSDLPCSLCNWNFVLIICDIFYNWESWHFIKSYQSGVTLCFQFVSAVVSAATSAAATTFASHVKSNQLNLRYLAQSIYGSQEMYWMTFPWPWPKVTAVASISKNLLVCAIKWQPLIASLHNIAALLPLYIAMVITWLDFGAVLLETFKKRQCIGWILGTICNLDLWPHSWPWPWMFQGQISNSSFSGIVGLIYVK